jgi:hypothetical protein
MPACSIAFAEVSIENITQSVVSQETRRGLSADCAQIASDRDKPHQHFPPTNLYVVGQPCTILLLCLLLCELDIYQKKSLFDSIGPGLHVGHP